MTPISFSRFLNSRVLTLSLTPKLTRFRPFSTMEGHYITLNTGARIPQLGLGTVGDTTNSLEDAIVYAVLEAGYRHIDTAFYYRNEATIGKALKRIFDSGKITRNDLFITTKVWPTHWNHVAHSVDVSLELMGLEYVDLLLVHWPVCLEYLDDEKLDPESGNPWRKDPNGDFITFYKSVEAELGKGRTKAVGVSNFSVPYLEKLLKAVETVPAMNQIELHPQLPSGELLEYCRKHGIAVTAYSPFGGGPLGAPILRHPKIVAMAEKYKCSPGSIAVNYHVCQGRAVIPKSVTPERIRNNAEFIDISPEDLAELEKIGLEDPHRYIKTELGVDLKLPFWEPKIFP